MGQPDIDYTDVAVLTDRYAPVDSLIPFWGTGTLGEWSLEEAGRRSRNPD